MIDDYKVKVIDDMLSRIDSGECYTAKLTAGGSHTIDIDEVALKLLKKYFSGEIEYTPTQEPLDIHKMNTKKNLPHWVIGYKNSVKLVVFHQLRLMLVIGIMSLFGIILLLIERLLSICNRKALFKENYYGRLSYQELCSCK